MRKDFLVICFLQRHFPGVLHARRVRELSTSMASTSSWSCRILAVRKTTIVSDPSAIPALTSSLFASRSTLQTRSITHMRRCAARHCAVFVRRMWSCVLNKSYAFVCRLAHHPRCKKDLRHDPIIIEGLRKINQRPTTPEEVCLYSAILDDSVFHTRIYQPWLTPGMALALKIGAKHYLECSAKTKEGIPEL